MLAMETFSIPPSGAWTEWPKLPAGLRGKRPKVGLNWLLVSALRVA
jgi:hypothetical protein